MYLPLHLYFLANSEICHEIVFITRFHYILTSVSCPAVNLDNGRVNYDQSVVYRFFGLKYPVDTVPTFSCDAGYTLSGSELSICQNSSTWNQKTPTCGNVKLLCLHKKFSFSLKYYSKVVKMKIDTDEEKYKNDVASLTQLLARAKLRHDSILV